MQQVHAEVNAPPPLASTAQNPSASPTRTAGGLYEGHYAEQAIRRYWDLWMPLLLQHQRTRDPAQAALLVAPLDVQVCPGRALSPSCTQLSTAASMPHAHAIVAMSWR